MRKLVNLNGNLVPTTLAYNEALKSSAKSLAWYAVFAVAFNVWGRYQSNKHEALMRQAFKDLENL